MEHLLRSPLAIVITTLIIAFLIALGLSGHFRAALKTLSHKVIALPATYMVTLLIWGLGTAYCIRTTKIAQSIATPEGWGKAAGSLAWVLMAVCVISAGHQFLIFKSLHELDHHLELRDQFKPWFGRPCEWILRLFAIICLLCIGGEITHVWTEYFGSHGSTLHSSMDASNAQGGIADPKIAAEKKHELDRYAISSLALFSFLILWDIGCIFTCQYKVFTLPPHKHAPFLMSDALGFVTWLMIVIALLLKQQWAIFVSMFTLAIYFCVVLYRLYDESIRPAFLSKETANQSTLL